MMFCRVIKVKMRYFAFCFFIFSCTKSIGQILNADALGKQVDSVHVLKGAVDFGLNFNRQNNLLISLDTRSDISYWYKNNLFVSQINYKLFMNGSKSLVNAGFAHLRYRMRLNKVYQPEFFFQYQLDNIRGMKERFLAGYNSRFNIFDKAKNAFYTGVGIMLEFEKWDYSGIKPDAAPSSDTLKILYGKFNFYMSYRQVLSDVLTLNSVLYCQTRPDVFFVKPRLLLETHLNFKIIKNLSFAMHMNVFYDAAPPVPIYNWYYSFINRLIFTF